ncbi:MAG: serine protease [Parachlamydiaceae bacterium]|nr:serine protease [Parachlamydiaceae bacterium]
MATILIIVLIGFLFVFLEFYLPGAIMGTIGGILIALSMIMFAGETADPLLTFVYVAVVIGLLVLMIRWTLKHIQSSTSKYSIYLNSDQEGYRASSFDPTLIGKCGIVVSDLKLGGYIQIEGRKYQAISQNNYIPQGEEVVVIGGTEDNLIVTSTKKEEL